VEPVELPDSRRIDGTDTYSECLSATYEG